MLLVISIIIVLQMRPAIKLWCRIAFKTEVYYKTFFVGAGNNMVSMESFWLYTFWIRLVTHNCINSYITYLHRFSIHRTLVPNYHESVV